MLTVMLADTDNDNLRNFKTYIKLAFPDMRVVGSINSNQNFISQVKEWNPNLIIADIRFFGTAAVRMIRDTYEFFPDKRFVIYGTYNDADYMEKVIEYGVIDYLYRPVKPHDLEKSLNHAKKVFLDIDRLSSEREKLVSKYKVNIGMFRDQFLTNLTGGYLDNTAEIESSLDYFGIKIEPGYSVFTVRIDHFKKIILTLDEMEKHLLVYKILLIINDGLERIGNGVAAVDRLNSISVILGNSMPLFETLEFCDELRQDILHQTNINVTIGLGRIYDDPRDISVSRREAGAALRYRHYLGYNTVIPIHYVEPLNNITYRYPLNKEERLVYSAVTGEYEECKILLGQIFDALRQSGPLPEMLVPKIIMDVLFSINRFASEQRMSVEERFSHIFPSKDIIALKTLDEAQSYMDAALKTFCAYALEIRGEDNRKLVKKVRDYLDEHYAENISLARLAAYAGTTPEFLNSIFVKSEDKSVYQYAISVRMDTAMKMLKDGGATASEAAKASGYEDIKHFAAVFTQYTGVTPDSVRPASLKRLF